MRVLMAICLFAFVSVAEAKYNPPEGNYPSVGAIESNMRFKNMRVKNEKGMTLQQYKSQKQTREDRKNERRDREDGVYKTPEERFKEMDADEDGFVTKEEMAGYIDGVRSSGRRFY